MIWFKKCNQCAGGDMYLDEALPGNERDIVCLQCGHRILCVVGVSGDLVPIKPDYGPITNPWRNNQ